MGWLRKIEGDGRILIFNTSGAGPTWLPVGRESYEQSEWNDVAGKMVQKDPENVAIFSQAESETLGLPGSQRKAIARSLGFLDRFSDKIGRPLVRVQNESKPGRSKNGKTDRRGN